jgi:hypothetical protein
MIHDYLARRVSSGVYIPTFTQFVQNVFTQLLDLSFALLTALLFILHGLQNVQAVEMACLNNPKSSL